MTTTVTDEQIRQLAETAKPYSLALLRQQGSDGKPTAHPIESHDRRLLPCGPRAGTSVRQDDRVDRNAALHTAVRRYLGASGVSVERDPLAADW